jgi:competence protein ComEC
MRFAALGFALGVCLLQQQPVLPGAGWLALVSAFAAIAGVGFSRRASPIIGAGSMFLGFAALGFAWAAALAHLRLSDRLAPALDGRDIVVGGVVAGLPQAFERGVRFDFDVESPETDVPRRIVLSSYGGFAPDDSQGVLPVRAGSGGASRCGCAGRTAAPTRTDSITRPGFSSAAFVRPAM